MPRKHSRVLPSIIRHLLAFLVAFLFLSPFLWVLLTSLKPRQEIYSYPLTIIPRVVSLEHYRHVLLQMPGFARYFQNSVVVTVITVLIVTALSALGGYALGRLRFRGQRWFMVFVLVSISVPYAIYLIPIFIMSSRLELLNTNLGLILPYVAFNLPMALFIMRGSFRVIPSELEDAARIDGCNEFQLWWQVMLPIARSGLATVVIFTFIFVWQEFLFAVTLMPDADFQTLPVGIVHLRDEAQAWAYGTLSTTIVLALIPILVVFILMRRFFIEGIIEGALKG